MIMYQLLHSSPPASVGLAIETYAAYYAPRTFGNILFVILLMMYACEHCEYDAADCVARHRAHVSATLNPYRVAVVVAGQCSRLDLVLVVDSSGSITEKDEGNWELVKTFLARIVDNLQVGPDRVHIGLVLFSSVASVRFDLRQYTTAEAVKEAIRNLPHLRSTTNTAHGLELMRTAVFGRPGDRDDVPNVAVLITDGQPNEREADTLPEAFRAKQAGVTIVAVGVTDQVNMDQLRQIASNSDDVITVDNFNRLDDIIVALVQSACSNAQPATGGWCDSRKEGPTTDL